MEKKRGVLIPVAGGPLIKSGRKWISISSCTGNELRISALYWDRIVAPIVNDNPKSFLFNPQYIADARELVYLGIAEAPVLSKNKELANSEQKRLLNKQSNVIRKTLSENHTEWSLLGSRIINAESITDQRAVSDDYNLLHLHLTNALPLPSPDTPLESIVAFRDKRRDELERVHVELGRLASTYVGLTPSGQAIPKALQDLNLALSDARRVFNEKWTARFFSNLKASFVADALVPAAAHLFLKIPLDKSFYVGAGLAIARSSYSSIFVKPKSSSPYSVLFDAENIR